MASTASTLASISLCWVDNCSSSQGRGGGEGDLWGGDSVLLLGGFRGGGDGDWPDEIERLGEVV